MSVLAVRDPEGALAVRTKRAALRDKMDKGVIFWNPTNLANYIARTFDK